MINKKHDTESKYWRCVTKCHNKCRTKRKGGGGLIPTQCCYCRRTVKWERYEKKKNNTKV